MTITAERTATAVPMAITIDNGDGVPGLTVVVAVRLPKSSPVEYLDFDDLTFKDTGWTTRQAAVAEVDATNSPGVYERTVGLDISAITGLPAAINNLQFEYDWSGSVSGNASETVQLVNHFLDVAAPADEMALINDAITAAKIANDAIGNTEIANGAISAAKFAAGAIDAAAIATDAVDADALAADAVAEIQSGLATSATQALHTTALAAINLDTDDIQSRLPGALVGGRMDSDVGNMQADTVDAAALAADAVAEIQAGSAEVVVNGSVELDGDLTISVWLLRGGTRVTAGLVSASIEVRDQSGGTTTPPATAAFGLDGAAVFNNVTPPTVIAAGEVYTVNASITDAAGTVTGQRGLAGA